jgi:apolipoprotein N-acyltransferase
MNDLLKNDNGFKKTLKLGFWVNFGLNAFMLGFAGILQTYATSSPVDASTKGWLQVASAAVLCFILDRTQSNTSVSGVSNLSKLKTSFIYGFVFSICWLSSMFWWIYVSLHTYGGLPTFLAVISVLLLAGALSLYYAVACAAYVLVGKHLPNPMRWILFGTLWTTAELARGQWFTGFPWGSVGYAHIDNALKLVAPLGGVYTIGGVAMSLASMCSWATVIALKKLSLRDLKLRQFKLKLNNTRWLFALLVTATLTVPLPSEIKVLENLRDSEDSFTAPISFSLLQGNIGQEIKYGPEGLKALNWYKQEIIDAKTNWVITPETALPVLKKYLPPDYLSDIVQNLKLPQNEKKSVLLGVIGNSQMGYTNSAEGINASGEVYLYSKHHLVPFGEFIPPWFKWFTDMMNIPLGSFTRGGEVQPSWEWGGQNIGVNICYEDVFGEEIASSFDSRRENQPTVLVNMSNIGWFGPLLAVEQHLNASRMRAIEMHRPVLRATNTGATAYIDENGYVLGLLPKYEQGVLVGEIKGIIGRPTVYASWSGKYGLFPIWFICFIYMLICITIARKKFKRGVLIHNTRNHQNP